MDVSSFILHDREEGVASAQFSRGNHQAVTLRDDILGPPPPPARPPYLLPTAAPHARVYDDDTFGRWMMEEEVRVREPKKWRGNFVLSCKSGTR